MEIEPSWPREGGDTSPNKDELLERLAEMINDGSLMAELDEAIDYDPDLMVD